MNQRQGNVLLFVLFVDENEEILPNRERENDDRKERKQMVSVVYIKKEADWDPLQ